MCIHIYIYIYIYLYTHRKTHTHPFISVSLENLTHYSNFIPKSPKVFNYKFGFVYYSFQLYQVCIVYVVALLFGEYTFRNAIFLVDWPFYHYKVICINAFYPHNTWSPTYLILNLREVRISKGSIFVAPTLIHYTQGYKTNPQV